MESLRFPVSLFTIQLVTVTTTVQRFNSGLVPHTTTLLNVFLWLGLFHPYSGYTEVYPLSPRWLLNASMAQKKAPDVPVYVSSIYGPRKALTDRHTAS